MTWEQGQHVAIVGDTGSGKTYLEALLLRMRSYNIVLRTKDDDIRWPGFKRVRRVDQIEILPIWQGEVCLVTRIGGLKDWAQEAFRADETRLS